MENANVIRTGLPMKRKLPDPQPTGPPAKNAAPSKQPSFDSVSSLFSHESDDDVQVVFEKKSKNNGDEVVVDLDETALETVDSLPALAALPIPVDAFASWLDDRDKIVAELITIYGNIPEEKLEAFHNNVKAHIFAFHGMVYLCTPIGPSAPPLTRVYHFVWFNVNHDANACNNNANGSTNNSDC
ncbi:unnamed protein product [Nippostrongylus brasiliensis]|uniref:Uncharacterized protein n=1 Tax=Nippostrongylus brasiliensis TaxID=27835 RepID=A0A0N4YEW7_NIPBR|nr:unnamed protein product [Nippostrongylus brasiliensis]